MEIKEFKRLSSHDLNHYGHKSIQIITNTKDCYKINIFTSEHKYSIVAQTRKGRKPYLGCIAMTRKPRAGEDHTRGNDLPDGILNKNTWNAIKSAIVAYEMVPLQIQPISPPSGKVTWGAEKGNDEPVVCLDAAKCTICQ